MGEGERRMCLENAADCGLDVAAITKRVVQRIRHRDATEIEHDALFPIKTGGAAVTEVKYPYSPFLSPF